MVRCKIEENIYKNSCYKIYKEAFSLMQPSNNEVTPVIILIEAMGKLSDKIDLGYVIAKQSIEINLLKFERDQVELKSFIEKCIQKSFMDYLICSCEISKTYEKLIGLKTTLIRRKRGSSRKSISNIQVNNINDLNKEFFRNITKKEVHKFSEISGDPNYIHKGDNPIVQAMLILLLLEDYLYSKKKYMHDCEITYLNIIHSDTDVFIVWYNSKDLLGIAEDKICFRLTFK